MDARCGSVIFNCFALLGIRESGPEILYGHVSSGWMRRSFALARIGLVPLPPVNHASGSMPGVLSPFAPYDALPTLGGSVAR